MGRWGKKTCFSCGREIDLSDGGFYHNGDKYFCKRSCMYKYERPHVLPEYLQKKDEVL